jgi:hypothetical protein
MKGFRFYKKDEDLEVEKKVIRKTPNEAIADAFAMVGGAMKQAVEQYEQEMEGKDPNPKRYTPREGLKRK